MRVLGQKGATRQEQAWGSQAVWRERTSGAAPFRNFTSCFNSFSTSCKMVITHFTDKKTESQVTMTEEQRQDLNLILLTPSPFLPWDPIRSISSSAYLRNPDSPGSTPGLLDPESAFSKTDQVCTLKFKALGPP